MTDASGFQVGDRVTGPQLGHGTITKIDRWMIQVQWDPTWHDTGELRKDHR